ncbi:hypothetical protein P7B02_02410 [Caulobacter segnis]|uniref:hypothetical protein n=1 Tax=Caulobacter segnis TaxID=88688 RepID=UPI002410996B|nr:hypothetical protein [Caulobacter segnis]MDG2520380.1 hypothetical protein [Caulobacter segnis]
MSDLLWLSGRQRRRRRFDPITGEDPAPLSQPHRIDVRTWMGSCAAGPRHLASAVPCIERVGK